MPTTIVSPGVAINVNDNSAVTSQPIQAGAAIIGPTVKGPVGIPTVVTTYSEYQNQFGDILVSGSQTYSYLTSISAYNYFNNGGSSLLVTRVVSGSFTPATASIQTAFVLETLSEGEIMNSVGSEDSSGYLANGTADNYRWQIVSPNTATGTFSLLIRKGNDSTATPSTIETHTNLSLDPFSSNYIEKRIGNSIENVAEDSGEYYLELTGSYPNNSKYVRVKQVLTPTPNYLDNAGSPQTGYAAKIPVAGRGTFGGATGKNIPTGHAANYYETISNTDTQGLPPSAYIQSIALLANKDSYRYNFITVPGLIGSFLDHFTIINTHLIPKITERGDSMAIIDVVGYGQTLTTAANAAKNAYDTSFVATYWPWAQTIDPATGQNVWVPASTLMPGVYMANDRVAYPWIAPAGTNRGIMTNVTRVERVITQSGRDTLYEANVNPLATLPGYGVVVYGQKTLQKKNTALDRVNVRRLLIELNNYIGQIAQSLVFEQNTSATRNEFLAQVNPYLSTIQQQQGLYDFNVVMDDTNNTPTVIDNNQLVGQIYIQPTKTSEFILLEFNILPTGVTI